MTLGRLLHISFLAGLGVTPFLIASTPDPRPVRVALLGSNGADEADLTSELSHRDDVILLERRQLDQILDENRLAASRSGAAVGRLLGAEFFLSLAPQHHLEAIGAQSGRIVYSGTSLDDAIRKMRETPLPDQSRIAVIEKAGGDSRQVACYSMWGYSFNLAFDN